MELHLELSRSHIADKRRGVTIVELLVVVAVIGLLIALLLPAVNSVRQSASRRECQNKLRQLGTAVYGYEETFGQLPIDGKNDWGYGAFLLSHLDNKPLYDRIRPDVNSRTAEHKELQDTVLPVFVCPLFTGAEASLEDGAGRSTYKSDDELFSYGATFDDIQSGASNTVLISETTSDLGWALPGSGSLPEGSRHQSGHNRLYADGSVTFQVAEP